MSLFLSKLLPIFIYPLGLSVLLGAISLIILWWQPKRSRKISNVAKGIFLFKRTRISAILSSIALALLLLSSNDICSRLLVQSLERQYVPNGELPTAEAIVILGGATRPKISPRPWYEVNEAGDRLLYGALLYKQKKAPLIVVTGGRAEWLGEGGNPESEDMAAILELMAVPREAIIQESQSFNTRDNAVNTRQILLQRNINKVLLVTSALHMPRAMEIFRKIGLESIAAPTDFLAGQSDNNKGFAAILDLLPSADALKNTTNAIKEYIGLLVYQLAGWA